MRHGLLWPLWLPHCPLPEGTCAPWSPVYSAPLFLKVSGAGIGATIGQEEMEEIITMGSARAVEKFAEAKRGKSIGGVEVIMGAGNEVAELDVGKTAPKPDKAVRPRQHIVRRGTIIDLAFRCASFKRDDARNDLVYGPGVSPSDIIHGDVPPPTEFLPLYDELHNLAGLAWPAGPETSPDLALAEVEVEIDAPVSEADVIVP
eukprot:jgi/Astpho2/9738/fgenesh1_pg.00149_%23_24_t